MDRKKLWYISIILLLTVIASITYFSYAFFTGTSEDRGKINIVAGTLNFNIKNSELINNTLTIGAGETKELTLMITNINKIDVLYQLYYIASDSVEAGYSIDTIDMPSGTMNSKQSKTVKVRLRNNGTGSTTVLFGVQGGFLNKEFSLAQGRAVNEQLNDCSYAIGKTWDFTSTGSIQTFSIPCSATYKLEVWGAQGGTNTYYGNFPGGYGGYSVGEMVLNEEQLLYIVVGGRGTNSPGTTTGQTVSGGYNGGGAGWASGGGATHIALVNGTLPTIGYSSFAGSRNGLIVAGGGGGSAIGRGGDGGGYTGKNGVNPSGYDVAGRGGSQVVEGVGNGGRGSFGQGGNGANTASSGAGGGLFGGSGGRDPGPWEAVGAGGGGSGYIDNEKLFNKKMVCYNCSESTETTIQTVSTTCVNEEPTENCAKINNGHARITLLSYSADDSSYVDHNASFYAFTGSIQTFTAPKTGRYKLEVWGAQGGNNTYYGNFPGGYGGYSVGEVELTKDQVLYVGVGGRGSDSPGSAAGQTVSGGYNGGGNGWASGGGATHIASVTGLIKDIGYTNFITNNKGMIVAGGGGGSAIGRGGDGGGYIGNTGVNPSGYDVAGRGGSQTAGGSGNGGAGSFGQGGAGANTASSGAGGGLFGGSGGRDPGPWTAVGAGGGGSGYLSSNNLVNNTAFMYCYNCSEDLTNVATFTVNTVGSSTYRDITNCSSGYRYDPIAKCAKTGNGYAKITYLGD